MTVTKCQAALRTLQAFQFFRPTCLCKEPGMDPDCNHFRDFLFDHPCGFVLKKGKWHTLRDLTTYNSTHIHTHTYTHRQIHAQRKERSFIHPWQLNCFELTLCLGFANITFALPRSRKGSISDRRVAHLQSCAVRVPAGTQMPEALRRFQDALQGARQQVQNGEQVSKRSRWKWDCN